MKKVPLCLLFSFLTSWSTAKSISTIGKNYLLRKHFCDLKFPIKKKLPSLVDLDGVKQKYKLHLLLFEKEMFEDLKKAHHLLALAV